MKTPRIFNIKNKKKLRSIKYTTKSKLVFKRASILLLLSKNKTAFEISDMELCCESTVRNIISRYFFGGIDFALFDRPRPGKPKIISDNDRQKIVAIACSKPPNGFARWTLSLLTESVLNSEDLPNISKESVRLILKTHHIKPWREKMWCVPSLDKEYIHRMEELLDVYKKPLNPQEPVICLDEKPIQLLDHKFKPIEATSEGKLRKVDYQYKRCGTANVFCAIEPLAGVHLTKVTNRRTKIDFAEFMKDISDTYPQAKAIHIVMDNLNTHNKSSLVEKFGEEKGSAIWRRFIVHYTPKHASWLNQAEIEIGIYSSQCLKRDRIANVEVLQERTYHWNKKVNQQKIKIDWTFTKQNARKKFKYEH